MQHQSDVPVPAPQRGGDPPGGQIHPQIQGRGDGGHRGESAASFFPPTPPRGAVTGRASLPAVPGDIHHPPSGPPPPGGSAPIVPAAAERRRGGGGGYPLTAGEGSGLPPPPPPPHPPIPGGRRSVPGTGAGGGGGAGAAAAGADVMPVTGHARRLSAGAAVRASAAPLRQLDGGGVGGESFPRCEG